MKILIDADGCPVVDAAIRLGVQYGASVTILCDTSHVFCRVGADTITVSKGADSVDFALVNRLQRGDLVVTQDYGLAAMCLARQAVVLSQNGLRYDESNIDALLMARHLAKKIRNAGGRLKGSAKRMPQQDSDFEAALEEILRKEALQKAFEAEK